MEPDTDLSDSTGWDFTMASGDRPDYSQQTIPLYFVIASSIFIMLKRFSSLSLLSVHHIVVHCSDSCGNLAIWLAGLW